MIDKQAQIANYTPNQAGVELLQAANIVLIVGVTGAGKDTIQREMLKSGDYYNLITTITREPRYNNGVLEQDGVEYYFISDAEAEARIDAGDYVEVSLVHGRIYGVTVDEIRRVNESGKIGIADVDVQGVAKYKKLSSAVTAIFLVPPSYAEWQRRVRKRYLNEADFMKDWPNRRKSAISELEKALEAPYYHFVINDELEEAVDACAKLAHSSDKFVRKDDEIRLMVRDLLENIEKESSINW